MVYVCQFYLCRRLISLLADNGSKEFLMRRQYRKVIVHFPDGSPRANSLSLTLHAAHTGLITTEHILRIFSWALHHFAPSVQLPASPIHLFTTREGAATWKTHFVNVCTLW